MAVAALLLDKSWQRPGALANCTMGEYRSACLVIREGGNGADLFAMADKDPKAWFVAMKKNTPILQDRNYVCWYTTVL